MNEKIRSIQLKVEEIISMTTTLSFPFFASEEQKRKLLEDNKINIERSISDILEEYNLSIQFDTEILWHETYTVSLNKFENLSDKQKINSFFLQEVMHEYSSSLLKNILSSINEQ